jgi:hypothetical protein
MSFFSLNFLNETFCSTLSSNILINII